MDYYNCFHALLFSISLASYSSLLCVLATVCSYYPINYVCGLCLSHMARLHSASKNMAVTDYLSALKGGVAMQVCNYML